MKLIIDIGNTRVKAALFNKNEIEQDFIFDNVEDLLQADLFKKYSIENCIVASVIYGTDYVMDNLKERCSAFRFTYQTPVPIKNLYKSANTLGGDRLAAAVGGNLLSPNKNVLIIDAGTCLKYNFVNHQNEFIGGGISPGLSMRFDSLVSFTATLPVVLRKENYDKLIGTNTDESILSGVELGTIAEVDGIIDRYKSIYEDLTIVFTGGDVNFFAKRLKNSIFADQFLILRGLNRILDYNVELKP